jgi:GAF domain-containing protein
MKDIIDSLKHFKLTKEIRTILTQIHPMSTRESDLSNVFEKLYHADLIGRKELLSLETIMSLSQYCLSIEEKLNGLLCGVYLFEEDEKRLWVGAAPSVQNGYREYSHGLDVKLDISGGAEEPIYIKNTYIVSNVERSEDIVTLNHKKALMADGFKSYCSTPLEYQGNMIGHTVLFSDQLRNFSDYEINMLQDQRNQIEKRLSQIKDEMIFILKK